MSKFIRPEVDAIEISGIRQFNTLASSIEGVIKLTIGELDLATPEDVKNSAIKAIVNDHTKYTSNKGIESLRRKIASDYLHYTSEEVILTVGTTEGLSIVLQSIIEEGDEVIIPTPAYVGYKPLITLQKGLVVELDTTRSNYQITRELLDTAYSSKSKCMIITSPNNPTGYVLTKEEMKVITDFVLEKDLLLISDEIYSDIIFTKAIDDFASDIRLKNNLVVLKGFSKSHAMTGFRIGYLISSLPLISAFVKLHQYSVTSTSTISQYAALKAIEKPYEFMLSSLQERRQKVLDRFDEHGISFIPSMGAFYIFYDISEFNMSSLEYCTKLLYDYKVALIPGEFFLGNHSKYVRLSYAVSMDQLSTALDKIIEFKKANA